MKIVGIVAEYNPFHKGHAYQIRAIREIYGEDTAVVCVISGDFVQRGEPASFNKYARAEAAVRCGADLVIEMPLHTCIGSAERFADGAVSVLGKLGVIDHLVFGSETDHCGMLEQTADVLLTQAFDDAVKGYLESGCSYPVARSKALKELMDGVDVTVNPNDNLGVEYIKAIKRHGFTMTPRTVIRKGAMHDEIYDGEMKSGSELRKLLREGVDISRYVPAEALAVYQKEISAGRGPVLAEKLEIAILSRLRALPLSAYADLADASEGLENRLYQACRVGKSLNEIYDEVKSKRYTHARIRRMVMGAALGISGTDYQKDNLYARVLALNERGGRVLRQSEDVRTIPVLSKPAMARKLEAEPYEMFRKAADAHDLYVLAYDNRMHAKGEMDWVTSPVFVRS